MSGTTGVTKNMPCITSFFTSRTKKANPNKSLVEALTFQKQLPGTILTEQGCEAVGPRKKAFGKPFQEAKMGEAMGELLL